jgi:hypothetical protein
MSTQPFDMPLSEMALVLVRFGLLLFIIFATLHVVALVAARVIDAVAWIFDHWLEKKIGRVSVGLAALWVVLHALVLPLLNIDGWKRFWELVNVFHRV